MRIAKFLVVCALPWATAMTMMTQAPQWIGAPSTVGATGRDQDRDLDQRLRATLAAAGFTGDIERTFQKKIKASLGRPIDPRLADLGRLLFFDSIQALGRDNSCAGCHSPTHAMGDSQPIAIGIQNNGIVGPSRTGPRNQRRSPTVINTALFPRLMWNSRFESLSGDPFDPSQGFSFAIPEDTFPFTPVRFSAAENAKHGVTHLLQAQAHMPPTELVEMGGFEGTCPNGVADPTLGSRFCQFDLNFGPALPVPPPDDSGFRNEPVRQATLVGLNNSAEYRRLFGQVFNEIRRGAPIDFFHLGKAIAEFEFTLVFANAPIDRFARGQANAMTDGEKRGALLFFGKADCVSCHRVDGASNEMFSDFKEHVVGVPQVFPSFGVNTGNVIFSGPGENEDFGREERSGDPDDRYKFRTAPLRNLMASPAFFHNGAFIRLKDAIRFHLDVVRGANQYDPDAAGVPADLRQVGPVVPEALIDPRLKERISLTESELDDLVRFVGNGLSDERARKSHLCALIPPRLPSGLPVATFEGCPSQ